MSGRRLLDIVAIAKGLRNVAKNHAALRKTEWDTFSQTSSLVKVVSTKIGIATRNSATTSRGSASDDSSPYLTPTAPPLPPNGSKTNNNPADLNPKFASNPLDCHVTHKHTLVKATGMSLPAPGHVIELLKISEAADTNVLCIKQEKDVFMPIPGYSSAIKAAVPRFTVPRYHITPEEIGMIGRGHAIDVDPFVSTGVARGLTSNVSNDSQDDLPETTFTGLFQSQKVANSLRGSAASQKSNPYKRTINPSKKQEANPPENNIDQASGQPNQQANAVLIEPRKKSHEMRESRVPSSRLGRVWQFGGLATSMTLGAMSESLKRMTGGQAKEDTSILLNPANIDRLVAKLSKLRGAALKLGQMISFQDSKMLPASIAEVLRRVQDSADFMPKAQRDTVLAQNLGSGWRELFTSFEDVPIAAASIGQVHKAVLQSTGQDVAVKIQYPGVSSSIDSDMSNLSVLLTASRLLPKGLYLDKTIANARTELGWECDYSREAAMGERFRKLLVDEQDVFHIPKVFTEASGPQVLTAEFCEGVGVTKIENMSQEIRDWIGSNILRLCLREIIEFKFMQTDPNWTNFFYNAKTHRIELLDFGASRDYPDEFIIPYIKNLIAASKLDRPRIQALSVELGYLTGHESRAMVDAHVNSVITLAEPFAETAPDLYDFKDQTITDRVREFIPIMLRERLAPPPEETYSLHRKLSGAFLLCAKLGSRVRCRELFGQAVRQAGYDM